MLLGSLSVAGQPKLEACVGCHSGAAASGGLDLRSLKFDLADRAVRERWIRIHDRVEKGEMPPVAAALPAGRRAELVKQLATALGEAERAEIAAQGRGPMRRLNREEFEQNLRDLLQLPRLDIRDMLPEDREAHHFPKTSEALDLSRVQLTAWLDAVESALRQAMVTAPAPPQVTKYRAVGTKLFWTASMTGGRESMFFVKDSKFVNISNAEFRAQSQSGAFDPALELCLFRAAGWPYSAYPQGFAAPVAGQYRVRFSARAVVQLAGLVVKQGNQSVPMSFRSRKPTSQDTAEDVRHTGGIIDIQPEQRVYETTVSLGAGQTIEHGLLGLPTPQVDAYPKIPGSYRFPPLPEGGAPGVAFQWLEVEGPIAPAWWPPASHKVLFDDLGVKPDPRQPKEEARRLLRRFLGLASRAPVPEEATRKFERLIVARLDKHEPFADAMLAGYQAFLCSDLFLYLPEPARGGDPFAVASRLSHFLGNSGPDARLMAVARGAKPGAAAALRGEAERLIGGEPFERFVHSFTDYWLSLRHLRRDDPDNRLYPEYRLDEYLVDSLERETKMFFTALVRENLPVRMLIDSDFTFVNDRLAKHYRFPAVTGSALRRVTIPRESPLGGLLTQGSILKVTANGTSTSPVLRGAWIMDRIMGQAPPPPPPGVAAVEPDIRGAKTIRDLLAAHTKSASCAACHAKFDPVGLALENFDVLGGWRTHYRGTAEGERVSGIDPAGHDFSYTIAGPVEAGGKLPDGRSFRDVRELKALLAANPRQLARNLLHQWTVYATGTPVRFGDRPEIEAMLDACAGAEYRVKDLMLALVESRIFAGQGAKR